MASLKEITTLVSNLTPEDEALIAKAYQFAENAHKDHKRYSGEPYFNHLFETAKILAESGMGPRAIVAGLLHDSIEDVHVAPETIEKEFGTEVLFLVQGVTKLGRLRYSGEDRHVESLRKLFVAMAEDIRVIIIKLADRLHNMRTLQFVPKEKQARIAHETLEIYSPIAYRLGMRKVNRELENLAFPYAYPKEFDEIRKVMKQKQQEDQRQLEKFLKSLKKALAKEMLIDIHTDYRVKSLFSLYKKYVRKDRDIEKIYDIQAVRVTVPTISDCYRALGIVHANWRPLPGRIKDYIAFPKPNGYKSIHTTIFTGDGNIIEVQIRTEEMHRESEYGIASHFGYKEGRLDDENGTLNPFLWIRRLLPSVIQFNRKKDRVTFPEVTNPQDVPHWVKELAEYQEKTIGEGELIKSLKSDFFEHRIFVFTPKGAVVDLPAEATPIDFAYAIHSEIGDHIAGVKVNGKLVSLGEKLRNGDIIEILTRGSSHPTGKWLDIAKTANAKKKIRSALDNQKPV